MARCNVYDRFVIPVDSKGLCFFCLTPCSCLEPTSVPASLNLKQMLTYLRVNVKGLLNCSPAFMELVGLQQNIGIVKATLCLGCTAVAEEFNKLYHTYERIHIQLENCVKSVQQLINEGDQSPTRMEEYGNRMRPQKLEEVFSSNFACNLRIETLKNCSSMLEARFAPVILPADCPPIVDLSESQNDIRPSTSSAGLPVPVEFINPPLDAEYLVSADVSSPANSAPSASKMLSAKKPFDCKKCSKSFKWEATFINHSSKCTGLGLKRPIRKKKNFKICKVCTKKYRSLARLTIHMRSHNIDAVPSTSTGDGKISKTRCSICGFCAGNKIALSLHKTDTHIVHLVKSVLECSVSDLECGQVIDLLFYEMTNSCFKCKNNHPTRLGNLKHHVVSSHFNEFVELVQTRISTRYENDGRNQSLLDYLGLVTPSHNRVKTEVQNDEVNENAPPARRSPQPGCSKMDRKPKLETPQRINKRNLLPRTRANQRVTRASQSLPKPKRREIKKKRKNKKQVVKKGPKTPLKVSGRPSLNRSNSARQLASRICPKCLNAFYDPRNLAKHIPVCRGLKNPKHPSERPKSVVQYPGPTNLPEVKKLYAIEQSENDMFNCAMCPYTAIKPILIKYHMASKHLPLLLHLAWDDPSIDIKDCVVETKLILKEMGAEGGERKVCFSSGGCTYSDMSLSRLKDHLVNEHFDELAEVVKNRVTKAKKGWRN